MLPLHIGPTLLHILTNCATQSMIIPLRYVFSVVVCSYIAHETQNTILHKQIFLYVFLVCCCAAYNRSSYIALCSTQYELIYNMETEQNITNELLAARTTNDLIASEGDNNNNNSVSRVLGAVWCKAISEIYIVSDSSSAAGIISRPHPYSCGSFSYNAIFWYAACTCTYIY